MSTVPYPYPNPQALFYQQYESVRRDEVVGILLALFLGTFGIHHFYLRRTGLGILYCIFSWSGIPTVLGFIECFFMPGRVREFNAVQAAGIAAALGMNVPPGWAWPVNINLNAPYAAAQPANAPAQEAYGPGNTLPLQAPVIACPQCHRTNVAGSRFCSGCGSALQ